MVVDIGGLVVVAGGGDGCGWSKMVVVDCVG